MAMTNLDLINGAFRALGLREENLSPDMIQDTFLDWVDMANLYARSGLFISNRIEETFVLTANTYVYTVGTYIPTILNPTPPYNWFNTTKPFYITSAYLSDQNSNIYRVKVNTREMYEDLYDRYQTFGIPSVLFYDAGPPNEVQQLGTIYLYPNPDTNATYTLHMISEKPLVQPLSLTDTITLAPEYYRALKVLLACEIATEYGIPLPKRLEEQEIESKRIMESAALLNKWEPADVLYPNAQTYNAWDVYSGDAEY
jgi:hypothetical protein